MRNVSNYDEKLINDIESDMNTVKAEKKELQSDKAEQEEEKKNLQTKRDDLQDLVDENQKILDTLYTRNKKQEAAIKANNGELLHPSSAAEVTEAFYTEHLAERQRVDILRGNTGIGPHRDDLQLLLNGLSLRSFGSQGQQRSGALALKLSQLEYVHREIGEFPVLLLDDVMSELDDSRRAHLLLFIDGRVQTFITVNDRELIPNLASNAYFRIENGVINGA